MNNDKIKIIEVKQSVFEDNNQDANRLREQLKKAEEYPVKNYKVKFPF